MSKSGSRKSRLEETLALHILALGVPEPRREYRFHPTRKWRFDFAWPEARVAAEVNGGTWVNGRHNRASSIASDYEKVNAAQLLGWRVYQFTGDMVKDGRAIATIGEALEGVTSRQ